MAGIIILSVRADVTDDVMQSYARLLPAVNSCSTSWADVTFHCHPQSHNHVIPRSASASPQVHKPSRKWCARVSKESARSSSCTRTHTQTHANTQTHTGLGCLSRPSARCHVPVCACTCPSRELLSQPLLCTLRSLHWTTRLTLHKMFFSWISFPRRISLNPKVAACGFLFGSFFVFFLTLFVIEMCLSGANVAWKWTADLYVSSVC